MFGCFNCSVLRDEKIKEDIRKDIEKKSEELRQLASQIGLTAQVSVNNTK